MNNIDLSSIKYRLYSQTFQDGITSKIFELIGVTNKFFAEFGSSGGKHSGGNTAYLREKFGMDGLLMDGSTTPYGQHNSPDYKVNIEFTTAENIVELFEKYDVPTSLDFLSVDVDGEDY